MAKKLYDLAVKTREYLDQQGNTKGVWLNVGAVMENAEGGRFIMLERTFNPAGLPNPDNRSNVLLSMFKPRGEDGDQATNGGGNGRSAAPPRRQAAPQPAQDTGYQDDDIPF